MRLSYDLLIIILSLIVMTSAASLPHYAKPGCSDRCGNVTIPFPFGIGAKCSLNEWYVINCNSSTPYLSALNHLEVVGVDLVNKTITVNTPTSIISDCQYPVLNSSLRIKSVDLDRSPFLFSGQNKLVLEGCGNAVIWHNGSALSGCSTICRNDSTVREKNNCLGFTCCETRIPYHPETSYPYHPEITRGYNMIDAKLMPYYLTSYIVELTGCGSAFIVDENLYEEGRFSSNLQQGFVPVSLVWNLTDLDFQQISCCPLGTEVRDVRRCDQTPALEGNAYLSDGCAVKKECASCRAIGGFCIYDYGLNFTCAPKVMTITASPHYAKPGCSDQCGNVRIPFPFGIGANCALNEWYVINCNSSTPYLSALNHLEVVGVDLGNETVTINTPTSISDCQYPVLNSSLQIKSVDLDRSPFLFSGSQNKLVLEGCGNAVISHNGNALSGCSSNCRNDTVRETNKHCLGMTCCETRIPYHPATSYPYYTQDATLIPYDLTSYIVELTGLDRGCGSAFFVDENVYVEGRGFDGVVPVSLLWTLTDLDFQHISCCHLQDFLTRRVLMANGTFVYLKECAQSRELEGNVYLIDGCAVKEECASCKAIGGYCEYDHRLNFTCVHYTPIYIPTPNNYDAPSKSSSGVILGVCISMGVVFLVIFNYALYKLIKKTRDKRQRKRFFKRNGGLLLKQQEEAHPSLVGKTILFTSRELDKATDNFNENRILGRGGQGTVYKGMLVNGRIVAVKKSKLVDESQLEQFINEVVILSQVNHRNVVKLLGCCLETDVPLLVSEFIPNGTLYEHLHNETIEFPISLNLRIQIATEVAGALAYLHSATSIPIYHRDIKTTNILLDDKYRAKVSDFGTSRFVSIDQTHLTTLVKGTFGYLDPEYFQSSQFTEKSDVYSFGVVLVELLTRERPISLTRFGEHRSLATYFMLAMEEGRVMSTFDATVIRDGTRDELLSAANIAMRCLNLNGKNRPTMKEVTGELETIRTSHIPSTIQTNIIPMIYGEELSVQPNGESTSTFLSFDDIISQ